MMSVIPTMIPTLGGDISSAAAINNPGTVVGTASNAAGYPRAYSFSNGTINDLATLVGSQPNRSSKAFGINNAGQIVGWSDWSEIGSAYKHAFLYNDGSLHDLHIWSDGDSTAYSINNIGEAAGFAPAGYGTPFACVFDDVSLETNVGGLVAGGSAAFAYGINDTDMVVGKADVGNGYVHAFLMGQPDLSVPLVQQYLPALQDLGTLGGHNSEALAINNAGVVVGDADTATGFTHAFMYSGGAMQDLGPPGDGDSVAQAINSSGVIVGYFADSQVVQTASQHAFVYEGGQMFDLNDLLPANSGWVLLSATGINDSGQVCGNGIYNGQQRGFVLTLPALPTQ